MRKTTAGRNGDDGIALILVVGSMLILAMLALTALAYTLNSQKFARHDQDYSASMTAAQSGIDDFISRLNRDDTYGSVVACAAANKAWQGPMAVTTNSCGYTPTTALGWLPVKPGETDPAAASFHYAIDASKKATEGTITVTATGRVNGVDRTIEVAVGKGGSTDYVYYTDYESADPSNVQAYSPSGATTAVCGGSASPNPKHWYDGRAGQGCTEITFISGDTLDGAVFTNDAILSDGGHFLKGVKTANPSCPTATEAIGSWNVCLRSGSTADFNGVRPVREDPLYLDDTSAAFVDFPGCHYFGSTRVIFKNNGTMTVWNKASNNGSTPPMAIAPPGGSVPTCGDIASLDNAAGATVDVPNEMVVYVAPSSVAMRRCFAGEIGGIAGETLPLGTYAASNVAAPTGPGQSYTIDQNMTEVTKYCGQGNLYIEGQLKGRTTVAAAQSVIVTGDLVLAGGMNGADMLGLVATNSVDVFHPRVGTVSSQSAGSGTYTWGSVSSPQDVVGWPKRYTDSAGTVTPTTGIQIAGSIQTLQHSFLVQKYSVGGAAGTLLVNGSIAQRWRGIVGQGSNGYLKLYRYDTRLKYAAPPYFPRWADSQWSLRYSGEVPTP